MILNIVMIVCWLLIGIINTINYCENKVRPTLTILWIAIAMVVVLEIQVILLK